MLPRFLRVWLPLAVAATVLAGTAFAIGQQILRTGGNDPQVQMAEDAAARLEAGAGPSDVIPAAQTDLGTSLAPWVIVYGPDRKPLAGSVRLDGKPAEFPTSVFANAQPGGSPDQVTWQPRSGVRAATVVVGLQGRLGRRGAIPSPGRAARRTGRTAGDRRLAGRPRRDGGGGAGGRTHRAPTRAQWI